jgi:hypothetical protein
MLLAVALVEVTAPKWRTLSWTARKLSLGHVAVERDQEVARRCTLAVCTTPVPKMRAWPFWSCSCGGSVDRCAVVAKALRAFFLNERAPGHGAAWHNLVGRGCWLGRAS